MRAAAPACALLALAAAVAPARAQDAPDEGVRQAEDEEQGVKDVAFLRECLDTLAARGAPARACVGLVARQCASEPDGESNAGAIACEQRESDVWQALLEAAEDDLTDGMSNAERASFTSAQDAWLAFRDAQCAFEAALFDAEPAAETERTACMGRLTADRTIALYTREADAEERSRGR